MTTFELSGGRAGEVWVDVRLERILGGDSLRYPADVHNNHVGKALLIGRPVCPFST